MFTTSGKGHEGNEGAMVLKNGSIVSKNKRRHSRHITQPSLHIKDLSVFSENKSIEKKSSDDGKIDLSPIKLCSEF